MNETSSIAEINSLELARWCESHTMGGNFSHLQRVRHSEEQVLKATCGPLGGITYEPLDQPVDAYLGIPYAKEVDRFERAKPAEPWEETEYYTKYGPKCPAGGLVVDRLGDNFFTLNDEKRCLNLNIFVPRWESKNENFRCDGRPVIVFIHGGSFEYGGSCIYDDCSIAGLLSQTDVIIVTFNYRVGVFGFLTIDEDVCKGNFGLWDQTLALQWVQKHIKSFGGNPDNITVLGESTGASCAELLALSPHSRDLFHKLILISGTASSIFAIRTNEEQSRTYCEFVRTKVIADDRPLPISKISTLKYFQTRSVPALTSFKDFKPFSGLFMNAPNFEEDFFPKPLDVLRKEAPKKPMIIDVVERDVLRIFLRSDDRSFEEQFKEKMKIIFNGDDYDGGSLTQMKISELCKNKVCDSVPPRKYLREFVMHYCLNLPGIESARDATINGWKVYLLCSTDPSAPDPIDSTEIQFNSWQPDKTYKMFSDKMTSYFMNFVTKGNPNKPELKCDVWQQFDFEKESVHFRITSEDDDGEMVDGFFENRWDMLNSFRLKCKSRREIFEES